MKVHFRGQTFEFDRPMTVRELLKELNLSPESTLVLRGEEVLTEDERLREDDEVRVISAISGGFFPLRG
ncbi:MAG: MoaD/ThiS family protein [Armatimonadota bacterium]|nr:MoaD/ThiS family protein [Armatimonadota bacterium]MDT7973127.1 MoaD/ThiS family protein [Armatimonadota bacterium]